LVLRNRRRLFDHLFHAASDTLLTLGRDPQRLGAELGVTMVLHTWTRDLRFHPHAHAVVTGGGLSPDSRRWVEGDPKYLFPVRVLSSLFRGKMLALLRRDHDRGHLDLPEDLRPATSFASLIKRLYETNWVTYAKPPFAGPRQVLTYLGRYTHRVALSNHRLLEVTSNTVTLRTRGQESVTLTPVELLRRFLLHVLPHRFVKIRHYGLIASSNLPTRLAAAQRILGEPVTHGEDITPGNEAEQPQEPAPDAPAPRAPAGEDWRSLLETLTGIDTTSCPACGSKAWVRQPLGAALPPRAPPRRAAA
jgi:hypothetical protein